MEGRFRGGGRGRGQRGKLFLWRSGVEGKFGGGISVFAQFHKYNGFLYRFGLCRKKVHGMLVQLMDPTCSIVHLELPRCCLGFLAMAA